MNVETQDFASQAIQTQNFASLFYRSRFTQVFGAVCFTSAGKTVEFRITAYCGYFIVQPVAFQHTEMAMVIGAAAAFDIGSHNYSSR